MHLAWPWECAPLLAGCAVQAVKNTLLPHWAQQLQGMGAAPLQASCTRGSVARLLGHAQQCLSAAGLRHRRSRQRTGLLLPALPSCFTSSTACTAPPQAVPNMLEIVPEGVDKWGGMQLLLKHLGLPRTALMAVGDGANDLQLVANAGGARGLCTCTRQQRTSEA